MGFNDGWAWNLEKRQNDNISYLNDALHRQSHANARTQRALKEQLTRLSGDLAARIDTVSRALDAFIELSDLRFELQVHQPAAVLRAEVRRFLVTASDSSDVPPFKPGDVDGYWLGPAASALAALLDGRDADSELAAAHALDRHRAEMFLTVSLSLVGRPALAAEHLPHTLGTGDGTLTRAQVALWKAAARGHFGERGRDIADEWMRGHAAPPGAADDAWKPFENALRATVDVKSPASEHAAGRLARLAALCAEALAGGGDRGAGDLFGLIEELVDEGAPLEAPLLRRSRSLRRQVEKRAPEPDEPEHFADPAGSVDAVLAATITGGDGPERASAVRLAAPQLLRIAERLSAQAGASTDPGTRTVKRAGIAVQVGEGGADPVEVAAALRAVDARNAVASPAPWAAATATGALFTVVAFITGLVPLAVLFGLATLFPAWKWGDTAKAARAAAENATWMKKALEKDVNAAREALMDRRQRAALASDEALNAQRGLSVLLGGGS
ncbi:MAG TPA: hypothetical protein VGF17_04860 [Phytomonospora sp.]